MIKKPIYFLSFLIILHAFILKNLVFFPYPEIFIYPYLVEHGFLPYRDIFDQHLPSLLMMPFNFYDLGITTPEAARLFLIGTVSLSHILIYLFSKKIHSTPKFTMVPNMLYLIFQPLFEGYAFWIDSLLVPIILSASYFTISYIENKKDRDLVLTGFFFGLAVFVKQVIAPLFIVIFAVLLIRKLPFRNVFLLAFSFSIPFLYLLIWLLMNNLFNDFLYWSVIFNMEVYAKVASKMPTLSQSIRTLAVFVPALYAGYLFRKRMILILLTLFMIFSFVFGLTRFEFVHIQPALPFAALLTSQLIPTVRKKKYLIRLATFFYIVLLVYWSAQFYQSHISNRIYFFDEETTNIATYARNMTKKGDSVFGVGVQPTFYTLADRLPAGGIFTVQVPWNTSVSEVKMLEALQKDPPKVIVRNVDASIDGQYVVSFMPMVNSFIDENYVVIERIGSNEILIQK